ncbi:MAG: ribonuclease P protein component [Acidobacteriota bacterium]
MTPDPPAEPCVATLEHVGLGRLERVRRRPEFLANYERGTRCSSRLMTVFVMANGGAMARLGIAATRKYGNAVQRNRAKRLIREVFRRHKPLAPLDVIVVPKRDMLVADYQTVESDYCAILTKRRHKIRGA